MSDFKVGVTFFGLVSFLALIPTVVWFLILSVVAWGLNQSGLTGEWLQNTVQLLHYWKYWWCLGVFVLAFIGQVFVVIGGGR